jgi:hypothetical protein
VFTRSDANSVLSPQHHGSHRLLLSEPIHAPSREPTVDAIIVPTARSSSYLQKAIDLSRLLGCTLVALCSKRASIRDAEQRALATGIELVAIEVANLRDDMLPRFATTDLLAGTPFRTRSDLSYKRNLGLLLARMTGWQRIVFLDDDITVPVPTDLCDAVSCLDCHAAVGLHVEGFPDNSVVCHAYRDAGGLQETFIGGGALAVRADAMTSFFPNIYNEDWFFLLDEVRLRPTAVKGTVIQAPYDPFANDRRARAQELGDTLAEGVYSLLDHGGQVQEAGLKFWGKFLRNRRQLINQIIAMVVELSDKDDATKRRMVIALKAARGRNEIITPELCVNFIRAWYFDRSVWRKHIEERTQRQQSLAKTLCDLGLMSCAVHVIPNERPLAPSVVRARRSRRQVS